MFKILRVFLCFFLFALIIRTSIYDQCVDPYQTAPRVKFYIEGSYRNKRQSSGTFQGLFSFFLDSVSLMVYSSKIATLIFSVNLQEQGSWSTSELVSILYSD